MSRRNLALSESETWRPPALQKPNLFRRFVDLQAASIWMDMRPLLANETGAVLDVGCGEQPYRSLLARARSYQGLDIAQSEDHFGYKRSDTLYVSGYPWPVAEGSIDLALCTEVLEHVPEPARLLAEVFRCLRPGGRLVMTVPFAARWHFVPHDYWRFTPSSLVLLLGEAGLEEVTIFSRGNPLVVAAQKVLALIAPLGILQVPLLPVAGIAALVGQASMKGDWGEDCLGYTIVAFRPGNGDRSAAQPTASPT